MAGWSDSKAPKHVRWVPQLAHDLKALKGVHLLKRLVRPVKGAVVAYQFGDASGSGYGSSLLHSEKISFSMVNGRRNIAQNPPTIEN
jgi:hypothetical protein